MTSRTVYDAFRTAFQKARVASKQQSNYRSAFRHSHGFARGSAWSTRRDVKASLLDVAPRLKLSQQTKHCPEWLRDAQKQQHKFKGCPTDPNMPCPNAFVQTIKMYLLEAHMTTSQRRHPKQCPAHGRQITTPHVGGCGGGPARVNYTLMKEHEACRTREAYERATLHAQRTQGTLQAHLPYSSPQDGTRRIPASRSHPFYTPTFSSLHIKPPRAPVGRSFDISFCRLFSTSRPQKGLHVVLSAATQAGLLLKSSTALSYINLLFRISVSFIPLSIKRAAWVRKARLASLAVGATFTPSLGATLFKILCKTALALPFVLLAAALLASLEITPISGRWRLLLLSEAEEMDIVHKVLEIGTTAQVADTRGAIVDEGKRDWVGIMRAVLNEEDAPAGTLLGGAVLDSKADWRAQLAENILARLEDGIPALQATPQSGDSSLQNISFSELSPPSLRYPLGTAARTSRLSQRNAVLVVDRPESNAFSFGFYGSVDRREPGVIIVFAGAIEEIVNAERGDQPMGPQKPYQHIYEAQQQLDISSEPSWLKNFFASLVPHPPAGQSAQRQQIGHVSKQHEEALAVLLSHELAHLVLSHTIESYANTALLWPQLEKLGWDMLRVFIYPITALLGPFVQDAVSATVKAGYEESSGLLPSLTSSCESRKMETEADIVALRLLANAGIDPRRAIGFWEARMASHSHEDTQGHVHGSDKLHDTHAHSSSANATESSFMRTHPADLDRIQAIRAELNRWEK